GSASGSRRAAVSAAPQRPRPSLTATKQATRSWPSARGGVRRSAPRSPFAARSSRSSTSWPSALFLEFDVLARDRVVLAQDHAIRVVAPVLLGHVRVS